MQNHSEEIPIITIDGPGGSGKGTIGLLIANKLGWHFLDSGALYRVLAYHALEQKVALVDAAILAKLAVTMPVKFVGADPNQPPQIILDNVVITDKIRDEYVASAASKISLLPEVRQALLAKQRDFAQLPGLVADGRDMGTVVFPQANVKLFFNASVEERAKRRYLQLKAQGINVNLADISKQIANRDWQDQNRNIAPMVPADDAIVIDTTNLSIDAVFNLVFDMIMQEIVC